MTPRSPDEPHRTSTPLELLFDLVFVVAVAGVANAFHHGLAEGEVAESLLSYCIAFFAIWWAWMNFTWFATTYDNDDIPYRLLIFVQMTGALILASGAEPVFRDHDLRIPVIGYVIMRIAASLNWLRAAYSDPVHRPAALRYAVGIGLVQIAWIGLLSVPESMRIPGFVVLAAVELLIPVWAEQPSPTPWHPHHILERYGLFTLLVLGESLLATSIAIESVADVNNMSGSLVSVIVGGLLIVYALWWLYFYQRPRSDLMSSLRTAFAWAYGHCVIFAATAAVGTGLAVMVDFVTHHAEISAVTAGMAVSVPVALYVLSLWLLQEHHRMDSLIDNLLNPVAAVLVLLTPFTDQSVLYTGIILSVLVVLRLIRHLS
jgi:low temperature requirement protein LtrA